MAWNTVSSRTRNTGAHRFRREPPRSSSTSRRASSRSGALARLGMLAGLVLVFTGCTDEVFVERPLFDDPPPEAANFIGYTNIENKRTVCGACHVSRQAQWVGTGHSDAWATLAASPGAQAFCESCHTVSSMGNPVQDENVGWVATGNPRFHDVQCEACHGPGLDHVSVPDAPENQPLAALTLGENLDQGCAACHSGVHRPFAEEWAASAHGDVVGFAAARAECASCHEGKGALRAWGVRSSFAEQDQDEAMAITCGVCHDPHDPRHEGELRFAVDEPDIERNLCMQCHGRTFQADPEVTRGPHAPQGPLLLGEAGWRPPGFEYPDLEILGTHGTEANPRLCATCHMESYEMEDPQTGDFTFRATGHSFQAIPCVDEDGIPTGETNCSLTERSFGGCTGCHGSESAARSALTVARNRINSLANTLEGLLDQVPEEEFGDPAVLTTADGSLFNLQLAREPGSEVHNPFLIEALLVASIRQVEADYSLTPSEPVSLERQLTAP